MNRRPLPPATKYTRREPTEYIPAPAAKKRNLDRLAVVTKRPSELRATIEEEMKAELPTRRPAAKKSPIAARCEELVAAGFSPALAEAWVQSAVEARTAEYLRTYEADLFWRPQVARAMAVRDLGL